MHKVCQACHKEFTTSHKNQAYCSHKCHVSITKNQDKICPTCKKLFHPQGATSVFCGKKCYTASQIGNLPAWKMYMASTNKLVEHYRTCKNCKKHFSLDPVHKGKKFCSTQCRKEYPRKTREHNYKILTCAYCHDAFTPKRGYSDYKYCSQQCYWKDKVGEHHEPRNGSRTTLICKQCSRGFSVPTYNAVTKHRKFCSIECANIYKKNNMYEIFYEGSGSPFYRTRFWREMRSFIKRRDRCTCQHCQKQFPSHSPLLLVHHIVPRASFPDINPLTAHPLADNPNNLTLLCKSCHAKNHFSDAYK